MPLPLPNTKKFKARFTVHRIRLDRMGYDRHGAYYGTGEPLFRVYDEDDGLHHVVRASSADAARTKAILHWEKTQNYSGPYGSKEWSATRPTVNVEHILPRY